MRAKVLVGSAILALGLALAGCSGSSNSASSTSAASEMAATQMATTQAAPMASLMGTFAGLNGKKAAGTATVSDGKVVLSGFSSDEGPDLHLYLTNGTDEAAVTAGMELGKVVFNQADQTFTLGSGVDASKYTDVVVHCDKAKAVFGAAPLS